MEKFPSDVKIAESLSRPEQETKSSTIDTLIINNHPDSMVKAIMCQTTVHERTLDNHDSSYVARSGSNTNCNYHRNSIQYLNIIPNRSSTTNTVTSLSGDGTPKTTSQSTSKNKTPISGGSGYNSNVYQCNLCNFSSLRQNVMIFHRKTHSNTIATTSSTITTPISTKSKILIPKSVINVDAGDKNQNTNNEVTDAPIQTTAKATRSTKVGEATSTTPAFSKRLSRDKSPVVAIASKEKAKKFSAAGVVVSTIKANKARITRSRRSTQTTITSEEGNLSHDDESSTRTDNTANSLSSSAKAKKKGSLQKSTTPVSKANSEELRLRLLADWSDEDNVMPEENKAEKKSPTDCVTIKSNDDKTEVHSAAAAAGADDDTDADTNANANNPKMATQQTTVVGDNSNNINSKVKSLKRIRNIPKKDRRDLILTEFNSECATKTAIKRQDSGSGSSSSGESIGLVDEKNNMEKATTTKVSSTELISNTNTVILAKEPTKIISCFEFCDDDEDEDVERNTLKSIANFKKKLLTHTNEKLTNTNEQETSQKFNQLSSEIENLLEQTSATVSDVDALQRLNSGSKEDLTAAVKGLPIKERGKRIFKSRNRTQSNMEQLDANQSEEVDKNHDKKMEDSVKNADVGKLVASFANGEVAEKTEDAKATEHAEKKQIDDDEEEEEIVIPAVKHSPIELFRCITPTDKLAINDLTANVEKIEEEEICLVEDESSTISEADAEFGSPTSMLDDDRLPLVTSDIVTDKTEEEDVTKHTNKKSALVETIPKAMSFDSEQEDDDNEEEEEEEEIESPPHEELSGNELEAEIKRIRNKRSPTKSPKQLLSARTPTPKKYLKKQQRQEVEDKEIHKQKHDNHTNDMKRTSRQRSKTPLKEKSSSKDKQDKEHEVSSSLEYGTVITPVRKRRGHMKITPCRTSLDKTKNKETSKENVTIDVDIEEDDDIIPNKRHKSINHSNKECEVLLGRTNVPLNTKEIISECSNEDKELDNIAVDIQEAQLKTKASISEVEKIKLTDVILRQTKLTTQINMEKLQKKHNRINDKLVMEEITDNLENTAINANIKTIGSEQKTNENINSSTITTTNKILNIENMQLLQPQSQSEVEEEVTSETSEIEECKEKIEKKLQNDNGKNKTLGMKRKHGETITIPASKVSRTNGNDNEGTLTNNNNNDDSATNVKSSTATATGGRKSAGSTLVFPHTTKLCNKNNDKQYATHKTQAKVDEPIATKIPTTVSKQQQQQQDILTTNTKVENKLKRLKSQTPELIEAAEHSSPKEDDDEDKNLVSQSLLNSDEEDEHQQPQSLAAFSVDDGQIMEMQNEEHDENPKFLAVPTHPIAGYNETFLLCTVENNQYKPIDGVPLYLDQDLNQLQPVPMEALEGQPILIVNQAPAEGQIPLPIKTVLPASVAEEETQMLCLPTQVTDIMAEAAAATVSTVMTPALVRGNESNLQLAAPMNSALHTADSAGEALFLMPDEETTAATAASDLMSDNAIIVNVDGQQIILEGQTLAQLLANPEGNTQLITDDGTEFVMTREILAILEAQQEAQQRQALSSPSSQDILAVALAGSDLYGNDMLEIETSQALQLVCSDGSLNFQPGAHLTPPITAQTSETNALLNQTPIMSTLEVPTSTSLVAGSAAAKLKSHGVDLVTPNLEDSLAVIGVSTQSSTIPTSLELPITVTNPAIAPKVTMSNVLPVSDALMQFAVQSSLGIIGDSTHLYSDS